MYSFYSFLLTLGFLILLPGFLYDALRKGKYTDGFGQRLGYLPEFLKNDRPVLWIHCVSVGEANAAFPIVKELQSLIPNYRLVISTTTKTGQQIAKKLYGDRADLIFYFPFDWKFAVRRVLRKLEPKAVLLMETEIWFNFIREADRAGAGVFIVNGRLSERSFNRFQYIKWFIARVLTHVKLALMQDEKDAKRLTSLGIHGEKVRITGNVKFDQEMIRGDEEFTSEMQKRFAFSSNRPLIFAASTHEPEEEFLLKAYKAMSEGTQDVSPRLMIAPRHPERFDAVADLLKDSGFSFSRRSSAPSAGDLDADLILLDSIGELRSVLKLAKIVFVGGSLIPHGGQNILEPAMLRKPIVTGAFTSNFDAIVKEFVSRDAIVQLPVLDKGEIPASLREAFSGLLIDANSRSLLADNAYAVMNNNRGAAKRTAEYLKPFLAPESNLTDNSSN